jgi:ABC-type protease/lipase transport system fused ATPase/permease subunit
VLSGGLQILNQFFIANKIKIMFDLCFKNIFLFFLFQINIFLVFSDYSDALMSTIIFLKNKKNIILIYF